MLKLDIYVYVSHMRQVFVFLFLNIIIRILLKKMFPVFLLVNFISIESFIWIQVTANVTRALTVAVELNCSYKLEEPQM